MLSARGAGSRRSRSRSRSASCSATSTAARSSRSTSRTSAARCPASRSSPSASSFLGVGFTNVALALVVLAVPPILTNAYVAVDGVERGRGRGGARDGDDAAGRSLRRVELPLALPLIFAGIRTAVVFVVATATIAAIAGGGGLGDIIVNQASYGSRAWSARRSASRCSRSPRTRRSARCSALLTPPGLRAEAHAFEPDVRPACV